MKTAQNIKNQFQERSNAVKNGMSNGQAASVLLLVAAAIAVTLFIFGQLGGGPDDFGGEMDGEMMADFQASIPDGSRFTTSIVGQGMDFWITASNWDEYEEIVENEIFAIFRAKGLDPCKQNIGLYVADSSLYDSYDSSKDPITKCPVEQ